MDWYGWGSGGFDLINNKGKSLGSRPASSAGERFPCDPSSIQHVAKIFLQIGGRSFTPTATKTRNLDFSKHLLFSMSAN